MKNVINLPEWGSMLNSLVRKCPHNTHKKPKRFEQIYEPVPTPDWSKLTQPRYDWLKPLCNASGSSLNEIDHSYGDLVSGNNSY